MKRSVLLAILISLIPIIGFSQAPPCPSGTLANVLGTSCTIGHLTFNFQTNFTGFVETVGPSGIIEIANFSPDAVGFIPMQSDNQAGFLVKANFFDNGNGTGLSFTMHGVGFSYSPQVSGAFEILGETAKVMGNIGDLTAVSFDSITAFDGQCFTNGQCVGVQPRVAFDPQHGGLFDQPSVSAMLGIPGVTGTGLPGQSFTTQINSFAIGGGEATLDSALFLYTVVPQTPLPHPARLRYKNIDIPGERNTFPEAINDQGRIAGVVEDFSRVSHGYATDKDGDNLTLIDFPGAVTTEAFSVSNRGDIVGDYTDSSGTTHGFLLKDGAFSTIDFPNAIFSLAAAINDRGEIAGIYEDADFGVHGFLLDKGNFTTIDDPKSAIFSGRNNVPVTDTQIFSLNNKGETVGISFDINAFPQSFLLSHGVFDRIEVPASPGDTQVAGLNNASEIVGTFVDINLVTHGFLLNHGIFSIVDFPNAVATFPSLINDPDQIVGFYSDSAGAFHGFLAERKAGNDSDWQNDSSASGTQPVIQEQLKSNTTPRPCVGRQPRRPDPATGVMTCVPQP